MANIQSGYLKTKNGVQLMTTVLYPVGAIYLSVDSTDPSKLFGGTWEPIKGQYLLGVDPTTSMEHNKSNKIFGDWYANYTNRSIEQIPQHSHVCRNYLRNYNNGVTIPPHKSYAMSYSNSTGQWAYSSDQYISKSEINDVADSGLTGSGAGHTHRVIPPSFTVYM